jgi:hypothetical protein
MIRRAPRCLGWGGAVVLLLVAAASGQERGDALARLVAAERAFAKMSVDTSQRDAFLANFADDGVWFTPGPSNTRADLRKRPTPAGPQQQVLDWEPVTGDVAASGDLGYTTGPWTLRSAGNTEAERKILGTGWFFSVWQHRPDLGWRVLADFGVSCPHDGTLHALPFQRARTRATLPAAPGEPKDLAVQLRAADVELARQVTDKGWAAALAGLGTADVSIYRDGQAPAAGAEAAARLLPRGSVASTAAPSFAQASAGGDLGVTYGAYTSGGQRGYYVRIWKRRAAGWCLSVDVANVEAPAPR